MLLPLTTPFLVVFFLSVHTYIYDFYSHLLSYILRSRNSKLVNSIYFRLNCTNFFRTPHFAWNCTLEKTLNGGKGGFPPEARWNLE